MTKALKDLIADIIRFRDERNWAQFHTFKDLMISLNIEATELIELAQWKDENQIVAALKEPDALEALADECADVFVYLLMICEKAGIDLENATRKKLAKNAAKYPVDKAYGSAAKYTELDAPDDGIE